VKKRHWKEAALNFEKRLIECSKRCNDKQELLSLYYRWGQESAAEIKALKEKIAELPP
jgi:hypothetical protein